MHAMNYHITTPSALTELLCGACVAGMFGQALPRSLKGIARGP